MTTTHFPLPSPSDTAYTPAQRAAMALAFAAAKPYLDEYGFICCSLGQVRYDNASFNDATHLAEAEVMRRIHGSFTVGGWLVKQGVLPHNSGEIFNLLPYRHRWLDSLIVEFSNLTGA